MMGKNIVSSLLVPLREHSPRAGLYFHSRRGKENFISYPDLYWQIARIAQQFRAVGIGQGSRVVLPFATSIEGIAAFFGLIGVGALPLSVKVPTSGGNRTEYHGFLQGIVQRFCAVTIAVTPEMTFAPTDVVHLEVTAASSEQEYEMNDVVWVTPAPDDVAFVQFSSGTTGQQKGVPIRHAQLIQQLELILGQDGRSGTDVGASWLPLYHDMGLVGALLTSMLSGHSLRLDTPTGFLLDPVEWLMSLSTHQVSITALPNFGLAYLLKRLDEADADDLAGCRLDALRRIYVGSDAIEASVISRLTQLLQPLGLSDKAITPCFGMAEAVLMVSCKPAEEVVRLSHTSNRRNIVSVGKVLPEFEVRILNEGDRQCEECEEGEILIRGGTLAGRYFEDTRTIIDADGFYHSSDIGFLKDGYLYISGRIGERIKINGENYFLPYLENSLESHPGLRPGGIAIIQSAGKLIVLAEPKHIHATDHLGYLRKELSELLISKIGIKVPLETILFVKRGQLKRTSSGKLQRGHLCRIFENQEIVELPGGT